MPGDVPDARRGRVHARGDRRGARHHCRHVEGAAVAGAGQAPNRVGGFRGRLGAMTDNRPDDDILDERIRALTTAQYHAPDGSVPRDAMWAQIAAARRAARTGATTDMPAPDATVIPLAPRRRSRTVVFGWSALLAAGLVLGIAIEREFI